MNKENKHTNTIFSSQITVEIHHQNVLKVSKALPIKNIFAFTLDLTSKICTKYKDRMNASIKKGKIDLIHCQCFGISFIC